MKSAGLLTASMYSPYLTLCGVFCATGSAPGLHHMSLSQAQTSETSATESPQGLAHKAISKANLVLVRIFLCRCGYIRGLGRDGMGVTDAERERGRRCGASKLSSVAQDLAQVFRRKHSLPAER